MDKDTRNLPQDILDIVDAYQDSLTSISSNIARDFFISRLRNATDVYLSTENKNIQSAVYEQWINHFSYAAATNTQPTNMFDQVLDLDRFFCWVSEHELTWCINDSLEHKSLCAKLCLDRSILQGKGIDLPEENNMHDLLRACFEVNVNDDQPLTLESLVENMYGVGCWDLYGLEGREQDDVPRYVWKLNIPILSHTAGNGNKPIDELPHDIN